MNKQNPTQANGNNNLKPGILGGLVILAIVLVLFLSQMLSVRGNPISLNDLANLINRGSVSAITVRNDTDLVITLKNGTTETATKEQADSLPALMQRLGVSPSAFAQIDYTAESGSNGALLLNIALTILPMVIIGWFLWRMLRSMRIGQDQALSFGRSRAKVTRDAERPMVTFNDVAGVEEAKQDLREIVEFLKEPDKFIQLGARIPKGVLMVGAPGTGKTLLARAVAGEAGAPFFSISGSEFVEMFVGVGASRVRDLFERAKAEAPAIIFVDEIDAVGRQRGAGLGGGHDEREQTLNQILVEMDGFDKNTNIIVIAATNRPDVLDPALLRPGRFDRKVFLDRPDRGGRLAILQVHTRGKPLASDVDLETMAKLSPGMVGADLENIVNEAAILAARRGKKAISMRELQEGFERVIAGPERKSRVISPSERRIIAFHEAGHAVVTHNLKHADPVHKITIVSRGQAGGYMMSVPEDDETMVSKVKFEDEMVSLLGGRAAEELTFDSVTSGASNDLQRATHIARSMITRYGMSEELGLRTFGEPEGAIFLGRELVERRDYSEEAAAAIDNEVSRMIERAYQRAKDILLEHHEKLKTLAQALLDQETLDREAFVAIMNTTVPQPSVGQAA